MTIMSIKTNFATETKKIKPKPSKKTKLINPLISLMKSGNWLIWLSFVALIIN